MSGRHLVEGLMQATRSRTHEQMSVKLAWERAEISRLVNGKSSGGGMRLVTLDTIQRRSGVPIQTLLDWYRLPEGAVLGRVPVETECAA